MRLQRIIGTRKEAKKLCSAGLWALTKPTPTPQRSKSFLVLFFKKELLSLWLEFLALFVGAPLLLLELRRPGLLFLLLWLGGLITYRLSKPAIPAPLPDLRTILRRLALIAPFRIGLLLMAVTIKPSPEDLVQRRKVSTILLRFLLFGAMLTILTRLAFPGLFLNLPRQHPVFWLFIMVFYPLLSVWPQEVIYRRFLFRRYAGILGNGMGPVVASALAFGFAHVIFLNWIAVALTTAGGAMFAHDYGRHRSLGLTCFEHSLYGCLIFTIGLGQFFYTGAAWHH